MAIISLYNHKGGVSKTTTTFNLAHLLARGGHRVLLVDADPQCNMTELCLGQVIAELDEVSARTGVIQELPGNTVLDALQPRIAGEIAAVNTEAIETVQLLEGLDILRGSVDLTSIEDDLAEAHTQRFANRTNLMRTYVAIGDMLVRLSHERGYEFIFIDLGPSAGALTRSFFLSIDAFFVPVAPDRFNVQAIRTLSSIITRWLDDHQMIVDSYQELGLPIRHGKPIFLGAITQFFKIYRGRPKAGFEMWMNRIPEQIELNLVPTLNSHSTEDRDLCPYGEGYYIASQIPDFGTLAPLMQEVSKPVFSISQEDTALVTESGRPWGGATWTAAQKRMANYQKCFEEIANRLPA